MSSTNSFKSIEQDVYERAVARNFSFLKSSKNIQEAYLKSIQIEQSGFLIPVGEFHITDIDLIKKLTDWRNTNVNVYPTQFLANNEGTKKWVKNNLLSVPDRLLFLVVDSMGNVLGHMGFNSCFNSDLFFEVDNVVKGEHSAEKGLFSKALVAMMEWARKTLNVNGFCLRVMDDNLHAINFYKMNGFVEDKKIPLFKEEKENFINYREAKDGETASKNFVRMIWKPARNDVGNTMILTAGPSISAMEALYSFDASLNGWNKNWSKYLSAFEKSFAEYVDAKYAIATSSCTGALQIALMSVGITAGDEVIVPDLTWVATANAVRYVGATPIFADIELDTWNIDANSVESLIGKNTKAIIPVHMYGHPTRMDKILAIAKKYSLKVIEDAAPAIGATWQNQKCGTFGDFAAFSFQGAKLLVTGEGGMLVTNNEILYEKALKISDQGRNPSRTFWIDDLGVKFKMSNIQAAIGLAQLQRVDELIEMKRRIFSWYEEGLADVPFIRLNKEVNEARSIYWMSSLLLDESSPINRDQLISLLKEKNVDTRPVFPAISQYPIWSLKQQPKVNAMSVGQRAINLPSGVCLSKDEVMYVCSQIIQILGL